MTIQQLKEELDKAEKLYGNSEVFVSVLETIMFTEGSGYIELNSSDEDKENGFFSNDQ